MDRKPTYSVREICSLIMECDSIQEIKTIRNLLVQDLEGYAFPDQGFLMTMLGIQIMKIEDGDENIKRFFRGCILGSF